VGINALKEAIVSKGGRKEEEEGNGKSIILIFICMRMSDLMSYSLV
jgi:hypothetical protein